MGTARELLVADEPQIRLVNEGRGAQAVAGGFRDHARVSELPQLVVDERQQIGGSLAIPGGRCVQE